MSIWNVLWYCVDDNYIWLSISLLNIKAELRYPFISILSRCQRTAGRYGSIINDRNLDDTFKLDFLVKKKDFVFI